MEITYSLEELHHLTNLSIEQLTERLTNDEGQPMADMDAKTCLNGLFTDKYQKIQNDSIGRGTKSAMKTAAKKLSEKFGVVPSSDFMATVDLIVEANTKQVTANVVPKDDQITKEMAMQNPEVAAYIRQLQGDNEGLKTKLDNQADSFVREKVLDKAVKNGLRIWMLKNPILSQDENKRKMQIQSMENALRSGNYKEGDNGSLQVLNADGNVLQDNFKDVSFEQYVLSNNMFDLSPIDSTKRVPKSYPKGGNGAVTHNFTDEELDAKKGYVAKKAELQKAGDKDGLKKHYTAFLERNYPDRK